MDYRKYTYWATREQVNTLIKNLEKKNIRLTMAQKAVCLPLSRHVNLGYVPPEAWQRYDLCRRQLSWYGASEHAGKYLVVSAMHLGEYDMAPNTIIMQSDFRPKILPKPKRLDRASLDHKFRYQQLKPAEWEAVEDGQNEMQDRWMKIMGIRGITYRDLFTVHCVNHVNFIEPDYFVTENEEIVPYSIAKTNYICSACLEFFNIIGAEFSRKYVVPCPGAVLFAGMSVNRYYEVVNCH